MWCKCETVEVQKLTSDLCRTAGMFDAGLVGAVLQSHWLSVQQQLSQAPGKRGGGAYRRGRLRGNRLRNSKSHGRYVLWKPSHVKLLPGARGEACTERAAHRQLLCGVECHGGTSLSHLQLCRVPASIVVASTGQLTDDTDAHHSCLQHHPPSRQAEGHLLVKARRERLEQCSILVDGSEQKLDCKGDIDWCGG